MNHDSLTHGRGIASIYAVGVAIVMFLVYAGNAVAEDARGWQCTAEGIYTTCSTARNWRPCQDYRTEGFGMAEDKLAAAIEAEEECSEKMMEMMKVSNPNGRPSVKSLCAKTYCIPTGITRDAGDAPKGARLGSYTVDRGP